MAIAHDTDSSSGIQTTSTSYSWNHTCSGKQRLLVVGFAIRPVGVSVNTLTYNGVTLTKIRGDVNGNRVTELWYLLNPTAGTFSIAVTLTGSPTQSDGHSVSFTGVSHLDANNGNNNAGSTAPTVTVTTITPGAWIVDILDTAIDDNVATPTSPQVLASKTANTGAHTGAQSYQGPIASPAGTAEAYTVTSGSWAISAAAFAPMPSVNFNNYEFTSSGNGISVTEKIR